MTAIVHQPGGRGRPVMRRWERRAPSPTLLDTAPSETARARLTVADAIVRGVLPRTDAVMVLDMLGLLPGQEGNR